MAMVGKVEPAVKLRHPLPLFGSFRARILCGCALRGGSPASEFFFGFALLGSHFWVRTLGLHLGGFPLLGIVFASRPGCQVRPGISAMRRSADLIIRAAVSPQPEGGRS